MESLRQDIAYGVRTLSRNPGFFVVAVLTLAIGIGSTTAISSIVHPVLIVPLPFKDSDRLVMIWEENLGKGQQQVGVSPPNVADWRRESRQFSAISIVSEATTVMTLEGIPHRLTGGVVSPEFFDLLGVGPFFLGRGFVVADGRPRSLPEIP